jgi:UDP:flavonoid glycosyltransferase YjiC (YdhE family)
MVREVRRDGSAQLHSKLCEPAYLASCFTEEAEVIRQFAPQGVISDFRQTVGISSALAKVPALSIHNVGMVEIILKQLWKLFFPALDQLNVPGWAQRFACGQVLAVPDWELIDPWSSVSREALDPLASALREVHYVGAVVRSAPSELPKKAFLRKAFGIPHNAHVVVVSLGGGTRIVRYYWPAILKGLAGLDAHFVLVAGTSELEATVREAEQDLRRHPGASVERFAHTDQMLELFRCADVAIVHGGHNTLTEALLCGPRVLVIPTQREQAHNARRVAQLGCVLHARPEQIVHEIAPALKQLLTSDTERDDRARRFAESFPVHGALRIAELAERMRWVE